MDDRFLVGNRGYLCCITYIVPTYSSSTVEDSCVDGDIQNYLCGESLAVATCVVVRHPGRGLGVWGSM